MYIHVFVKLATKMIHSGFEEKSLFKLQNSRCRDFGIGMIYNMEQY